MIGIDPEETAEALERDPGHQGAADLIRQMAARIAELEAQAEGASPGSARLLACGLCYEEQGEEVHPHPECQVGQRASSAGVAPATDQTALRDRIRRVLCERDGQAALWGTDMLEPDEYGETADAVLSVLPASVDRAGVLRWAADQIDAETRQAKADGVLEPDKYRPCRDASAQLRALAGCQECASGLEHSTHCPTPESHNWGCGCQSDVAAAIASCPGRELDGPSPCRCPCEGCKHNCAAHTPPAGGAPQSKEA
jgi:hypothetical protein